MKHVDNVMLPNGEIFKSWEVDFVPTGTYHVAAQCPDASDDNDGSAEHPFLTVSRAAEILMPGEEVVIHEGIYHEWVRPARGGDAPDRMITYRAAEGECVILDGSDEWKTDWVKTKWLKPAGPHTTYEATLRGAQFEGANPFCLINGRTDLDWGYNKEYEFCRGMIFVNGEKLTQVSKFEWLQRDFDGAGVFWMEDNGMTVHMRLRGEVHPNDTCIEITTREQVFSPLDRYQNYIKVSGLHLRRAANPVPITWPQRGMLSTFGGHHWIVEDCELGYANTVALDMGGGWWDYGTGECQGYNIIRRNHLHHFGICGIAGWHNMSNERVLIEDNLLTDCCTMPIPGHCESASIKVHRTLNSLVRRNVIVRTYFGSAIWLDGEICNTRITQNVCLDNRDCTWGQIFLEINYGPNMVDNNILYGTKRFEWAPDCWDGAKGLYNHDAERIIAVQNLIYNGEDCAIYFRQGSPERTGADNLQENNHRIWGNILGAYDQMLYIPNTTTQSDKNVFAVDYTALAYGFTDPYDERGPLRLEKWREKGFDAESRISPMMIVVDTEKLTMRVLTADPQKAQQALLFDAPDVIFDDPDVLRERVARNHTKDAVCFDRIASVSEAFTFDLFGNDRGGVFSAGPIVDMPMDGSEFSIDPRMPGRTK